MRRRQQALEKAPLTSMVDIIFQLMIFFLVTMSVMPSVKSAPQVEGSMILPTPKQGDTEVSMVVQFQLNEHNTIDYYVLQGNELSAEFYNQIAASRSIVGIPKLLRNIGTAKQVYYDEASLKGLLMEQRDADPAILIRAPKSMPYGAVVKITGYMHSIGIAKIAWVAGTLKDLKAEIRKTKGRRR